MSLPLPPGRTPRRWQLEALDAARAGLADPDLGGRILLSAATGTGKGSLIAGIGILTAQRKNRVLILTHRDELVADLDDRVRQVPGAPPVGVVKASRNEWLNPIVVASVQSVTAKRRKQMGPFGLVLTDEAHHAVAPIYGKIYSAVAELNPNWKHIGFTATPFRSAGNGGTTGLGKVFRALVYEYGIADAIAAGDLVPVRAHRVDTQLTLDGVRTSRSTGDFVEEDLARCVDVEARNELVVQKYLEIAPGQPALVFCASVEHARHVADTFVAMGVRAKAVWGDMPLQERQGIIKLYRERPDVLPVLCSKDLIFEGFDAPATRVVLKARPTKSRVVFQQMVGRGLRLHPGKTECLFLDFVDNGCELDLQTAADLGQGGSGDRKGRPLGAGDRVLRRHHEDWGVGVVDEVRPGGDGALDVALVVWPGSRVHPEGATLPHPVVELRRAPEADAPEEPDVLQIQPRIAGVKVYEIFLLPGQKVDAPDAIGWYEYQGTWTVGGFAKGLGRVKMHVRPGKTVAGAKVGAKGGGAGWDVWFLRPPVGEELVGAVEGRTPPDVATLVHHSDGREGAIAWAQEDLRARGVEVAPILADWKQSPITDGQVRAMRALGLRRDTSEMSRGEANALLDAVIANQRVGDVLDPKKAQRREWARKAYSKKPAWLREREIAGGVGEPARASAAGGGVG